MWLFIFFVAYFKLNPKIYIIIRLSKYLSKSFYKKVGEPPCRFLLRTRLHAVALSAPAPPRAFGAQVGAEYILPLRRRVRFHRSRARLSLRAKPRKRGGSAWRIRHTKG